MLNWLLSNFTYLPNFIIWLPSFSFPRLVPLVSKCHVAIFAFVRFFFFHSVKKVSKPSIFCENICVSKRTLVILIRMLYCNTFFKAKNFVILFFLSFLWFLSGEKISWGVIFLGGRGIFTGDNFLWGKFWGVIFTGEAFIWDNFLGGNFLRGSFLEGNFLRGNFLEGNFLGGNFLGGNFPDTR